MIINATIDLHKPEGDDPFSALAESPYTYRGTMIGLGYEAIDTEANIAALDTAIRALIAGFGGDKASGDIVQAADYGRHGDNLERYEWTAEAGFDVPPTEIAARLEKRANLFAQYLADDAARGA